jgi:hypothetical protein
MEKTMLKVDAFAARIAVCLGASLFTCATLADYEVYNEHDTTIDLQFMTIGAQFGQDQAWFGESHSFLNVSASHWTEFGAEPGLKFESKLGPGTFFGAVSGVYTRSSGDDASGVTTGMSEESKTNLEQGNLGYKFSDVFSGLEEDTVSVQLGRFDYSIGTGMLINDGGSDGGDRGGWYLGMRKAFQNGAIVKLDSKTLKAEVFRFKNNPRRGGPQGEARGTNVDYTFGESGAVTLGGSFLRVYPEGSGEDAHVYDGRASWTVWRGLTFSGEYAYEDGDDSLSGKGYYAQALYEFSDVAWTPSVSYRYALFDDEFNPLAYGFTDYGYWFQGEIAGNYPLFNNNLKSNMFRVNVTPIEGVVVNLFYYNFKLANPTAFGVASDDFGDEVDLTVDWQATDRIYVAAVLASLTPGDAAEEWTGGGKDWLYAMLSVSFTL